MKIGVISDTHLKEPHSEFRKIVEAHFKEVDQIVHAGDFIDLRVAEYLSGLKELIAVCGNMDPPEIREAFPHKKIFQLGRFRIGLIHGGGPPFGLESRVRDAFDEVDLIIYGHSHTPANHRVKEIYFFNPGSPTRSFFRHGTIGILNIGEKIQGEIIEI